MGAKKPEYLKPYCQTLLCLGVLGGWRREFPIEPEPNTHDGRSFRWIGKVTFCFHFEAGVLEIGDWSCSKVAFHPPTPASDRYRGSNRRPSLHDLDSQLHPCMLHANFWKFGTNILRHRVGLPPAFARLFHFESNSPSYFEQPTTISAKGLPFASFASGSSRWAKRQVAPRHAATK